MKCLIVDDDELSRNIIEDLVKETPDLELTGTCSSAMEAYKVLREREVDLLFLDVEMPEMSGIDLIKNLDNVPSVILITSHSEYALESYDYNVTDFVVKPISQARFLKSVDKALKLNSSQKSNAENIFVKTESKLVKLPLKDIAWVEALGNYVNIHTPTGRHTVLITMKEIHNKLPQSKFKRVHRSAIVNLDKIESIEDNLIEISGKNIPIGKVYREDLLKELNLL